MAWSKPIRDTSRSQDPRMERSKSAISKRPASSRSRRAARSPACRPASRTSAATGCRSKKITAATARTPSISSKGSFKWPPVAAKDSGLLKAKLNRLGCMENEYEKSLARKPLWLRLTEERAGSTKSVFQFDVQGSVAKSTHAGIPWLLHPTSGLDRASISGRSTAGIFPPGGQLSPRSIRRCGAAASARRGARATSTTPSASPPGCRARTGMAVLPRS